MLPLHTARPRLALPACREGEPCLSLAGSRLVVLMLPLGLEAMRVGITATTICYVLLNLRYRHLVRAG